MAELAYAQIKKIVFVPKSPVTRSDISRYPGRLPPWLEQDIKQFFVIIRYKTVRKTSEI